MKIGTRPVIIAGNWKMNKTPMEAMQLINDIKDGLNSPKAKVVVCVPAIDIAAAAAACEDSCIMLGAQNCHWEKSGAFTGEISAQMLCAYDVRYCVIGHSERRQYFGESDKSVNLRAIACIESGIVPIICVGENLEQRQAGAEFDTVKSQLEKALENIAPQQMENVVIAYEPVWAIGTGKTATDRQAQEMCAFIRSLVKELKGDESARKTAVLYGGSMNRSNAAALLSMEDIDGGLIGGASLKAEDFLKIIDSAK